MKMSQPFVAGISFQTEHFKKAIKTGLTALLAMGLINGLKAVPPDSARTELEPLFLLATVALESDKIWYRSPLGGVIEKLVRIAGLEPARVAPLPPQSSVSANSTICAAGWKIMKQSP